MAEIKVTSAALKRQAEQLTTLLRNFRTEVNNMDNAERQMATMYQAESQQGFQKAFNDDKGKMEIFANVIQEYINALNTDAGRYETAESRVRDIARTRK